MARKIMSKTAKKTKPSLWKRIVARIKAQASHGTEGWTMVRKKSPSGSKGL